MSFESDEFERYRPDTDLISKRRPKIVFKTVNLLEERRQKNKEKVCQEPGCTLLTTGQKPFCIEHLGRMPYIANLERGL